MMLAHLVAAGLSITNPADATAAATVLVHPWNGGCCDYVYLLPPGAHDVVESQYLPASITFVWQDASRPDVAFEFGGSTDVNGDGDTGTDADIEAFFRCVGPLGDGPDCEVSDWDNDGTNGSDEDLYAFFRSLAGG